MKSILGIKSSPVAILTKGHVRLHLDVSLLGNAGLSYSLKFVRS